MHTNVGVVNVRCDREPQALAHNEDSSLRPLFYTPVLFHLKLISRLLISKLLAIWPAYFKVAALP
jgi:hypothetical protein